MYMSYLDLDLILCIRNVFFCKAMAKQARLLNSLILLLLAYAIVDPFPENTELVKGLLVFN